MGLSADAYARQLKQLLPRGAVWRLDPDSWLSKLLLGIADELARVNARGEDLVRDWDPSTALETLPDWERVLGLPEDGATLSTVTSERQRGVASKYVARGGQSAAYFIGLAAKLGYTVTIHEYQVLRAGFRAGDLSNGTDWAYAWRVDLPASQPSASVFRAGSRAGERLAGFEELDVQAVIRRAAPAQTVVLFSYTA